MYPVTSPDPLFSMWAWIAHDLRFYRTRAKMSGEVFGRIMSVVRSTVSRMESGEYKIKEEHAAALDKYFNTGGHFTRLLYYAQLGHDPDWFKGRLDKEQQALVIKAYEALVIPGLLQTRAYATALIASGTEADVERLVDERLARQEIFKKDPAPLMWVITNECALHQMIGGREVAREQLARLLELSELPNMVLRVVPQVAGAHVGLDGSFTVMSVAGGDVAYASAAGGGRLIATVEEVRQYSLRYDRIGQQALPEILSRDVIRRAMEEL
jgi:transcriptional regulator with XRE-family HTH domain